MPAINTPNRRAIMEALHAGYHRIKDISTVTGIDYGKVSDTIAKMVEEGLVSKRDVGDYYPLVPVTTVMRQEPLDDAQDGHTQLEGYMLKRTPVQVSFEREALVSHDVIKLELKQASGQFFEVRRTSPITRVFIGEAPPVWHPDQVVYREIREIRVTYADGSTKTSRHNPLHAIVVHGKGHE